MSIFSLGYVLCVILGAALGSAFGSWAFQRKDFKRELHRIRECTNDIFIGWRQAALRIAEQQKQIDAIRRHLGMDE